MKIICYHNGQNHQKVNLGRFVTGLRRHGLDAALVPTKDIADCDLAVFWSHHLKNIIYRQKAHKAHYLVMERGYVGDRFHWTSLGFDGLNGRAVFPQIDDGGARWRTHHLDKLKPWTYHTNKNAVIMGQVRRDAAVETINFLEWAGRLRDALIRQNFRVYFRPHPREPNVRLEKTTLLNGSLEEALDQAALAVTYNSNSGVDALLAGVPTYAHDPGSMVFNIAQRDLVPKRPDRSEWAKKIAWCQWTPEEIESGEAWDALKQTHIMGALS